MKRITQKHTTDYEGSCFADCNVRFFLSQKPCLTTVHNDARVTLDQKTIAPNGQRNICMHRNVNQAMFTRNMTSLIACLASAPSLADTFASLLGAARSSEDPR